jgi:hypothetical protein
MYDFGENRSPLFRSADTKETAAMRALRLRLAPTLLLVVWSMAFGQFSAEESAPAPDADGRRDKLLVGDWTCDNAFISPTGKLTRVVSSEVITQDGPNMFRMLTVASTETVAPGKGDEWPDTRTREPRSRDAGGGSVAYLSFVDDKRVRVMSSNGSPPRPQLPLIDVSKGRMTFDAKFPAGDGSIDCVKR